MLSTSPYGVFLEPVKIWGLLHPLPVLCGVKMDKLTICE